MLKKPIVAILVAGLTGCSGYNPLEDYDARMPTTVHNVSVVASDYPAAMVEQGRYLAELLACGTCHTDGALVGDIDPARQFAGSRVGIAYSNPFEEKNPGVLYPANITPDRETGIGAWQDEQLVRVIRTGVNAHGERQLPVMPWPGYAKIKDADAKALVAFLRSLKPIRHQVPANVLPGEKAEYPFVHFGAYQSKR
jgi:hypothetical protein